MADDASPPSDDSPDKYGYEQVTMTSGERIGSMDRRGSMLRRHDQRVDHLRALWLKQKIQHEMIEASTRHLERQMSVPGEEDDIAGRNIVPKSPISRQDSEYSRVEAQATKELDEGNLGKRLTTINQLFDKYGIQDQVLEYPLEVRMQNFSYLVPETQDAAKIATVYNSSNIYRIVKWYRRAKAARKLIARKDKAGWKPVLDDINLVLKPGKMYLLLGPPGAGKSSLLKAISAHLHPGSFGRIQGKVLYNGKEVEKQSRGKAFFVENAFAYIDQLDKHAPRLTVRETFDFAFQTKAGGKGMPEQDFLQDDQQRAAWAAADRDGIILQAVLDILGLSHVQNTFVGDNNIRGVSGGQRRRVTVGEMLVARAPVLCGDEISTGLDAASTYDMLQVLLYAGRRQNITRIISLLQPSPETVSLFDDVIVMAEGRIIYAGPIPEIEDYFASIGYHCPAYMDVADFVQMVSTEEGKKLWDPLPAQSSTMLEAPSAQALADHFVASQYGQKIRDDLESENRYLWRSEDSTKDESAVVSRVAMAKNVQQRYANSFWRNTWLLFRKFLILWKRDKRVIVAAVVKNVLMGVAVGGVFSGTEDPISLIGALFQGGLFLMLGAMNSSSALIVDRIVFYKHHVANFYSASSFIVGRTIAALPQAIIDVLMFGTILFFMVGFCDRDFTDFLVFEAIFVVFAVLMQLQLAVFASFSSASGVQVYSACILLLMILFGGFIVPPDTVPDYFFWMYWWNPFAWCLRSLVVLEFRNERWGDLSDSILENLGFIQPGDGDPFSKDWVAYGFLYMIGYTLLSVAISAILLASVRNEGGMSVDMPSSPVNEDVSEEPATMSFQPVTLSFRALCYDVKSSLGDGQDLRLLSNVTGTLRSGRMCALMGTSGAGKTTLMDVIALRKRTGRVTGEVFLNGFPQDEISFRRCSGYVYQFDVQSPQLTVRETVLFSARLRLDVDGDARVQSFVDQVLRDVELWRLKDVLVGYEDGVGLSFEQKKRLSIAVELAASPSVIFLDEPTSGLDARSALLVAKTLRKISDQGRTVCATIHQPSSSVFEMFDDLLLLRRGGEVVYHGALGKSSATLIRYFESQGTAKIELGENPANWMLRAMDDADIGDLHELYKASKMYADLEEEIEGFRVNADPTSKLEYDRMYAATKLSRRNLVLNRLKLIYWRSPAYNLSRITTSCVIAVVLASIFVLERTQQTYSESEMRSRLSVIFLSFIITGIMAMLAVLPTMTEIRDMFYRHKDASMYGAFALNLGLAPAEIPFILLSTASFTAIFLSGSGIGGGTLSKLVGFWGFFTFSSAMYSYFGQAFVCLVKPLPTALILSSVFIGLNNFMAGLIVRPQLMVGTFFAFTYYISPSHYVYEGMVMSLYQDDVRRVVADPGTEYYDFLTSSGICDPLERTVCSGTTRQYVEYFFGGNFDESNIGRNAWICGLFLATARITTYAALAYIRHE